MVFLRKLKPATEHDVLIPAPAAECMECAFWYYDAKRDEEICSDDCLSMLSAAEECTSLDAAADALQPASAEILLRMIAEIKQGKAGESCLLERADKQATLLAVPNLSNSVDGKHVIPVIWFYNLTRLSRAQLRALQENDKLKNDVKRFSTLLNMAPYPIWQRDEELNVNYYNLAYGALAEELPERSGVGGPELDRKAHPLAKKAYDTGVAQTERRHLVVEGQRKLYTFSEQPLREEKMLVGFAQDISEVESLQEELQRYMSAQADLLESSASAMAIYGPDMRLKSFNYAFANLWKLEELFLESEPSYAEVLENLRERRSLPEQANFQMFKQSQIKLFTDLIEPREEFFYLPDGRTLRVIAIPHALGGILFAYEDVTDRLALERSYNTLIAVQRETLDNLHEGVAVFGEDGRLKLSNPVYLNMWGLDALTAKAEPHITAIVDRAQPLYMYDQWEEFRAQRIADINTRSAIIKRLDLTDGRVIDCATVPLPDGGTLITYLDVTATTLVERSLRERNEALTEADRLKTQFLANVSYELRSPLTSISGFSDMLMQQYFGELNEKQREYVEGIHQSSQHLMELVNDILDLASIEAGYMQLDLREFNVYNFMKSALTLIQERAKEHKIAVSLVCAKTIGEMEADETRIKQIIFNLLSNAIRFTPSGGKVELGARSEGEEWVVMWVLDNGPGIPEEERPYVFDKFFKGKNRDTPKSKGKSGTGLGLSMVKSFIELHGGTVEMETGVNGTKITCLLPRKAVEKPAKNH